jgi:hypothetical protein
VAGDHPQATNPTAWWLTKPGDLGKAQAHPSFRSSRIMDYR